MNWFITLQTKHVILESNCALKWLQLYFCFICPLFFVLNTFIIQSDFQANATIRVFLECKLDDFNVVALLIIACIFIVVDLIIVHIVIIHRKAPVNYFILFYFIYFRYIWDGKAIAFLLIFCVFCSFFQEAARSFAFRNCREMCWFWLELWLIFQQQLRLRVQLVLRCGVLDLQLHLGSYSIAKILFIFSCFSKINK